MRANRLPFWIWKKKPFKGFLKFRNIPNIFEYAKISVTTIFTNIHIIHTFWELSDPLSVTFMETMQIYRWDFLDILLHVHPFETRTLRAPFWCCSALLCTKCMHKHNSHGPPPPLRLMLTHRREILIHAVACSVFTHRNVTRMAGEITKIVWKTVSPAQITNLTWHWTRSWNRSPVTISKIIQMPMFTILTSFYIIMTYSRLISRSKIFHFQSFVCIEVMFCQFASTDIIFTRGYNSYPWNMFLRLFNRLLPLFFSLNWRTHQVKIWKIIIIHHYYDIIETNQLLF